jgi:predicted transcriptional regulator of viral defense system
MGAITPAHATGHGLSRSGMYRAAGRGQLDRVSRGIYLPAGSEPATWDWLEAVTRRPRATVCLISALAHHELTDAIPTALDVAIPRGVRIPPASASISWHSFDAATFDFGREDMLIAGTETSIGIYSAERSIADAFRLRGDLGYEVARDALKEWLRRGGKPARLMDFARVLPRAKAPILTALDSLA